MGYFLLAIAITGELIGTIYLKESAGYTKPVPTIISVTSYVICFFVFSKALLSINLSIAYATWSAIGLIAATLMSVFIFKEGITAVGIFAIVMITLGVIILNVYGTPQ